METVPEIKKHIDDFNSRLSVIADRINQRFGLSLTVEPVDIVPPSRYNAYYNQYIRDVHRLTLDSLNNLSDQLQRYNLIGPVNLYFWTDWDALDDKLSEIEERTKNY